MLRKLILKADCLNISPLLKEELDKSLEEIEQFFYSDFWLNRLKFDYHQILKTISKLKNDTKFELFNESQNSSGMSNKGTMIALNINMKELNDSYINNIIMHEFGHRQYNQEEFKAIVDLNKEIIGFPGLHIKDDQILSEKDYKYFTNDNELRQRIIPIIKEMYDNDWTAEQAYDLSENLKLDDIKNIFNKDYIIYLLNNIL